jgi:GST-like protein
MPRTSSRSSAPTRRGLRPGPWRRRWTPACRCRPARRPAEAIQALSAAPSMMSTEAPVALTPVAPARRPSRPPGRGCGRRRRHWRPPRLRPAQGLDLEQGERRPFANINRPIAGPTHDKELPVGKHPLQLYSLATPNGVKVTIMLEELLAARAQAGAEYDAWLINIGEGDQFGSGFVAINPNSKIPALLDRSGPQADPRVRVRRDPALSGGEVRRVPADRAAAPAPSACRGCSGRWAARPISAAASATSTPTRRPRSNTPSTVSRWRPSASSTCSTGGWPRAPYLAGDDYTIADIAVWPWYGGW